MQVRDLQTILSDLDPYQRLRIVMTGHVPGCEFCRFADNELPRTHRDNNGVIELLFAGERTPVLPSTPE